MKIGKTIRKADWSQQVSVQSLASSVSFRTFPCSAGWPWCASTCWERSEGWSRGFSSRLHISAFWRTPSLAGDSQPLSPSSLLLPTPSPWRSLLSIRGSGRPFALSTIRIRDASWFSFTFPCASSSSSTWSASSSVWSASGQIQEMESVHRGKTTLHFPNWRRAETQESRW